MTLPLNLRRHRLWSRISAKSGGEQRNAPHDECAAYAAKHGRLNALRHFISIASGGLEPPAVRCHKAARRRIAKTSRNRNRCR